MLVKYRSQCLSLLLILMGPCSFITQAKSVEVVDIQENSAPKVSTSVFLKALMLEKGAGSFIQSKHFKFLAVPIRSTGHFIVEQQTVLWQTKSPVFSEVLIQKNGVYQRLEPKGEYQLLVDNAEFSSLLVTVFTGQISPAQWQVGKGIRLVEADNLNTDKYCLSLQPKAKQLQQLFQHIDLCIPSSQPAGIAQEGLSHFDLSKRHISLFDQQNNKTQISMQINSRTLSLEQAQALVVNQSVSNANDRADNNQAQVNVH